MTPRAADAGAPRPLAGESLPSGLTIDDIDLFEINEAFAVVAEKYIRDLKLDRARSSDRGDRLDPDRHAPG